MERITQTEAHSLERRVEAQATRRENMSRLGMGLLGGFAGGFAHDYLIRKFPSLATFGPGDKVRLAHVMLGAGALLGRKKTKMGKLAFGVGCYGAGKVGEPMGFDFAAPKPEGT